MILTVGTGFLGSRVAREAAAGGEKVIATVRNENAAAPLPGARRVRCDVTSEADVKALRELCRGEELTVFYFAACHNVDFVYEHPCEARKVNIDALRGFLDVFEDADRLIFSSTDCVYGENPPDIPAFREDSPKNPVNVYGEQKLEAEELVRSRGFTAARLPFMLGPSLTGKPHFYDKMISDLRSGRDIEMMDGFTRSAISYATAAELLLSLAKLPADSLPSAVNVCGDEALTKYETALRAARQAGLPTERIKKISEAESRKFFKDRRASRSVMDNSLLKALTGVGSVKLEF
ncbi:MAG: NAD(P)-dependent oxidoreductase [Clostridia bacterium]|nr:NAD(P)-dependent oxidoreductase [Clostridia bacterium]